MPSHPKFNHDPRFGGYRQVPMSKEVYIDREDFCDDTSDLTCKLMSMIIILNLPCGGRAILKRISALFSSSPPTTIGTTKAGDNENNDAAQRCGVGTESKPKGFNRLVPGGRVRLRYAYVVTCDEVVRDAATGEPIELVGRYEPETRAGMTPAGTTKVKGIIQWVSVAHAVKAEVRLYDRLFKAKEPGKVVVGREEEKELAASDAKGEEIREKEDGGGADFLRDMNPDSIRILQGCMLEPSAAVLAVPLAPSVESEALTYRWPARPIQFERVGYFVHDIVDSTDKMPVFNRVVTLRDTWLASGEEEHRTGIFGDVKYTKSKRNNEKGAAKRGGDKIEIVTEKFDPRFPYVLDAKLQKNVPDIARVEMRVGKVVACAPHPNAESLLVEQIDVGDTSGPRTVVSGLAAYMQPEELVGKRVVVVCNLKPAKMRGINSDGMVLCGSKEVAEGEVEAVELLVPPEGAAIGERLTVEASTAEESRAAPDRALKSDGQQKVWRRVAKLLRTNDTGEGTFDSRRLLTSAGACKLSSLRNVRIG